MRSKIRMNSRPMILRFSSGSLTPSNAARNWSWASTTLSCAPVAATKSFSTCSTSPLRSRPWSTNTQVSWEPMARCTSAPATAESTPPLSAQMARFSPIWVRMRSTCSSTMFTMVQVRRHPAASRKRRSTSVPWSVCSTSGWNWTPNRPRSGASTAATGVESVVEVVVKPSGAAVTESPCDIHTVWTPGRPPNRTLSPLPVRAWVRPNSLLPVSATVPPSSCTIAWNP